MGPSRHEGGMKHKSSMEGEAENSVASSEKDNLRQKRVKTRRSTGCPNKCPQSQINQDSSC
jgi:hypothetical protein